MRLLLTTVAIALLLGACSRSVEADVQAMCAAIERTVAGDVYPHIAANDQHRMLTDAMSAASRTAELSEFVGHLSGEPSSHHATNAAELAAAHGFSWDCPAFDEIFVGDASADSGTP